MSDRCGETDLGGCFLVDSRVCRKLHVSSQLGADKKAGGADHPIHDNGKKKRSPHAQKVDQPETTQERTHCRANGIEAIKPPHTRAHAGQAGDEEATQYREGGAHAGDRNDQKQSASNKSEKIVGQEVIKKMIIQYCGEGLECYEKQGKNESIRTDTQFQQPVDLHQLQWLSDAVDSPPREITAQAETAHEHGQHDAHRKRGTSNDLDDHPGPEDFVCQAGETGEEKTAQDQRKQRE